MERKHCKGFVDTKLACRKHPDLGYASKLQLISIVKFVSNRVYLRSMLLQFFLVALKGYPRTNTMLNELKMLRHKILCQCLTDICLVPCGNVIISKHH